MKQGIIDRAIDNIKGLHELKNKVFPVGRLKYKHKVSSIPLKQYNITYRIIDNNYIKIQGIKQHIRVYGLENLKVLMILYVYTLTCPQGILYFLIHAIPLCCLWPCQ